MSQLSAVGPSADLRAPPTEASPLGCLTGAPLPDAVYGHPMSIFLSDRYRHLRLFDLRGEEARREHAEALQQLRVQRAVEGFFRDGCLVRAAVMGFGGGVLGILLGSFFFTMKPVDVDTTLSFRAQIREQYKSFFPEVAATAKNFAKIGALYSLCECVIDRLVSKCFQPSPRCHLGSTHWWSVQRRKSDIKERATHDFRGAVYGGCLSGALLAMKGGPRAMLGGSLAFGAFSGVIELLQPFAGFE